MKSSIILTILIGFIFTNEIYAQLFEKHDKVTNSTSIGIIIYTNDPETVWNAMRLANYSKSKGDTVNIFLLGKGVELDNMAITDKNIKEQTDQFLDGGGSILGCGTCLHNRKNDNPQVCKFSSLKDLYELIRNNRTVLTF